MIQSVGMTKRQLCRMLVYEGLYYAGLTLLVSWAVSALAVGIGVRAVTAADDFATFHFTLLPLGICTPLILPESGEAQCGGKAENGIGKVLYRTEKDFGKPQFVRLPD